MTKDSSSERCRLVLVAGPDLAGLPDSGRVAAALAGGDVASLILVQGGTDIDAFQRWATPVVAPAQERGVAVIVAGDTRVAGRVGADGVHLGAEAGELAETVRRHAGRLIVGAGGAGTRHDALELGEAQPDYVMFGRFGHDTRPEPHPRDIELGEWWASIVEIPCIVQAGSALASVEAAAATGAEFVALSSAVFAEGADPAAAVAEANAILDRTAPRLGDRA